MVLVDNMELLCIMGYYVFFFWGFFSMKVEYEKNVLYNVYFNFCVCLFNSFIFDVKFVYGMMEDLL